MALHVTLGDEVPYWPGNLQPTGMQPADARQVSDGWQLDSMLSLNIEQLTVEYRMRRTRKSVLAIEDVSFGVERGEFVAIVGPSGCGKTTILNAIAGLLPERRGRVYCSGQEVNGPGRERAMVFQTPALLPWRTVLRNVGYGLELQGLGIREAGRVAQGYIELVGLCFARQLLAGQRGPALSGEDRLTPLVELLGNRQVSGLILEGADTNEGKALAGLLKRLERPAQALLEQRGLWWPRKKALPRLHLFFLSGNEAFVALADPANSAPWPMGVQRLRMPPGAPSRSTLKLEEALLRFLTPEEQGRRLAPGLRAVDLGAAPGGWTWQFVRRSIRVTAVDNGPLDPRLLDSGIVDHRREDGRSIAHFP